MTKDTNIKIKNEVKQFWNEKACGTWEIDKSKFTLEYFEAIEKQRYEMQPEIFSFAEFTRFHNKKLLEVGVGAGTDFLQWVRAGTESYGIDLTEEAIAHVQHRLDLYGLQAKEFRVADSEALPYDNSFFDVVWSWGVIHHTPNTMQALSEIIRVLKPGGTAKIMIYHRHSILAYLFWIKHALLKLKPFRSISEVLWNHMESIGTKAYTVKEIKKELSKYNLTDVKIKPVLTYYDKMLRFGKFEQLVAKFLSDILGGNKAGWFLTIEFKKS